MEHTRIANAIGALSGAVLVAITGLIGQHEMTSPAPRPASTDRGIEPQRPAGPETSNADTIQSTGLLVLFLATGVTATAVGPLKCLELMRAVKEINEAPFNAPRRRGDRHRIANAKTRCGRWIPGDGSGRDHHMRRRNGAGVGAGGG